MDKKYAVKNLAAHLNIKPENVITFGDGENDIGMLEVAGAGVAMENASELVKKVLILLLLQMMPMEFTTF